MALECPVMDPTDARAPAEGHPRPIIRPRRRPGLRGPARRAGRVLGLAALLVVGLAAMLFALQVDLIFPGAKRQGDPATVVKPGPDEQLVTLSTARGEKVVALFAPALTPDGAPHPA